MDTGPHEVALGTKDAAVIVRASGKVEIILPKQSPDDPALPASEAILRCAVMLNNKSLTDTVDAYIEEFASRREAERIAAEMMRGGVQ